MTHRPQSGFSIVELMVAVAIGAIVVTAAVQMLSVNQRTFMVQQASSGLIDEGQLFLRFVTSDLRRAGFSGTAVSAGDSIVFGGANGSNSGADYDRLTMRFFGTTDCQGSTSAAPVQITNIYQVNNNGDLTCDGSLSAAAPVALLENVEAFRVLYGVDATTDGEQGPFLFDDAEGVAGAVAAGRPVIAVRLALLMARTSQVFDLQPAQTWNVLDRSVNAGGDRAMRRVFSTTVMLRNLDWEVL